MQKICISIFLFLFFYICPGIAFADSTTISDLQTIFKQASRQTTSKLFIIIVEDPQIVAQIAQSVDGKESYLFVNLSKLWLINSRDEWAFVIFHEISHKIFVDRKERFSNPHEMEYACDLMSVEFMYRFGYDMRGAIDFFIKYNDPESPSHPSGRDRIKRIQQKIEALETQKTIEQSISP